MSTPILRDQIIEQIAALLIEHFDAIAADEATNGSTAAIVRCLNAAEKTADLPGVATALRLQAAVLAEPVARIDNHPIWMDRLEAIDAWAAGFNTAIARLRAAMKDGGS